MAKIYLFITISFIVISFYCNIASVYFLLTKTLKKDFNFRTPWLFLWTAPDSGWIGEKSRRKDLGNGWEEDLSATAIVGVKFASEKSPDLSKRPRLRCPLVNFTNIFWAASILHNSYLSSISFLTFLVCIIFEDRNRLKSCSQKLVKYAKPVNFTKQFWEAFYPKKFSSFHIFWSAYLG